VPRNTSTAEAVSTTPDIKITGNPDVWELICKASNRPDDGSQGWSKSTKSMTVPGGRVIQVTTEFMNFCGAVIVCAEALTFVPDP